LQICTLRKDAEIQFVYSSSSSIPATRRRPSKSSPSNICQTYTHTCTHTHTHAHIHTHTHAHIHTHTHMHARTHTCTRAHAHTCTYICMYTYLHVHTHTHTHTSMSQDICNQLKKLQHTQQNTAYRPLSHEKVRRHTASLQHTAEHAVHTHIPHRSPSNSFHT